MIIVNLSTNLSFKYAFNRFQTTAADLLALLEPYQNSTINILELSALRCTLLSFCGKLISNETIIEMTKIIPTHLQQILILNSTYDQTEVNRLLNQVASKIIYLFVFLFSYCSTIGQTNRLKRSYKRKLIRNAMLFKRWSI
jgi:hypothetical protein